MKRSLSLNQMSGITLVALVVTIVVLLILAGITINYALGDNSIFTKASEAKLKTNIAKSREKLEIVLSSAQIEKHTNKQYNENEYLDEYITSQIKESEVIDDIVIVDGYVFELDRSVPKIGEYVGKKDELTFPEISVSEIEYSSDYKSAKFIITAKEGKNGISKIEIIQYGKVLDTFEYGNSKEEIIKEYTVQQNGTYTVKVYSKLKGTEEVEVTGLVMAVEYSPNGNEEYKKEHTTKITVKETTDRVKSLKYQWSKELTIPEESTFIQNCSNNSKITGKDITGTYYLWTLLETESGKKNICRSEGFNFDNEGPTVKLISTPISEKSFILTATSEDPYSDIQKYEFFVGGALYDSVSSSNKKVDCTVENQPTGVEECSVIVTDVLGNSCEPVKVEARTLRYTWGKYNTNSTGHYELDIAGYSYAEVKHGNGYPYEVKKCTFDSSTRENQERVGKSGLGKLGHL